MSYCKDIKVEDLCNLDATAVLLKSRSCSLQKFAAAYFALCVIPRTQVPSEPLKLNYEGMAGASGWGRGQIAQDERTETSEPYSVFCRTEGVNERTGISKDKVLSTLSVRYPV